MVSKRKQPSTRDAICLLIALVTSICAVLVPFAPTSFDALVTGTPVSGPGGQINLLVFASGSTNLIQMASPTALSEASPLVIHRTS